ncbi:MAG: cytochrome c [Bryobacteraceae bacterium]
MRRFFVLICIAATSLSAHDIISTKITFSREISRILYQRCASCHHDGGAAFSLETYEAARPWAKAIKEEVLSRRMPPWGAVKGFGEFRGDRSLTQVDLEIIADWVEGGAPEGDPRLLPAMPQFPPAANDRAWPAGARETALDGAVTLHHAEMLTAIRPKALPEGTSVKVVAERPDGSIEPLVWIENYRAAFCRTYIFAAPLPFPAGTRVVMSPETAGGTFSLFDMAAQK